MNTLMYLLLGLASGIISGMFGIGGGIIIVPALIYLFGFSQHEAQGTSLAMLLPPIGLLATWKYWQAGNIHLLPAVALAISFFFGAWGGAYLVIGISQLLMRRLFGGAIILIGIYMLSGK